MFQDNRVNGYFHLKHEKWTRKENFSGIVPVYPIRDKLMSEANSFIIHFLIHEKKEGRKRLVFGSRDENWGRKEKRKERKEGKERKKEKWLISLSEEISNWPEAGSAFNSAQTTLIHV